MLENHKSETSLQIGGKHGAQSSCECELFMTNVRVACGATRCKSLTVDHSCLQETLLATCSSPAAAKGLDVFQEAGASNRFSSALHVFDDVKITFRDEVTLAERSVLVFLEPLLQSLFGDSSTETCAPAALLLPQGYLPDLHSSVNVRTGMRTMFQTLKSSKQSILLRFSATSA